MRKQSAPKKSRLGILVAGKTGTPERIFKGERINDGWYVFFAPKADGTGHMVVCIRIEGAKGSSEAVRLAGKHIIPLLLERNYIKSFEPLEYRSRITVWQAIKGWKFSLQIIYCIMTVINIIKRRLIICLTYLKNVHDVKGIRNILLQFIKEKLQRGRVVKEPI